MASGRPKGGRNTEELKQLYGQAKVWISMGVPVATACRKVGLSRHTYYWYETRQKQLAAKRLEAKAQKLSDDTHGPRQNKKAS